MRLTAAVFLGFLLAPVLSSQPAAAGDRPNLLQDYLHLLAEWRRSDALLSSAADPKELLSRIGEAEEKWTAAAAAKDRYLKAIRPLHHPRAELLAGAVVRSADTSRVESAHENILTDLSADLANLERKLKEGGISARRRAALQQQRDTLAALRDLYRSRLRAFEQLRQINQALEKTRSTLADRYRSLAGEIVAQDDGLTAQISQRMAAYEQMRQRALQQAAAAAAPKPAPPPKTPPPAPLGFPGKWVLSAARPEKFSDAAGPLYGDVSVHVEIAQSGDRISGVYNGVVFVPPGERYNSQVSFRFTGPAGPGPVVEAGIDSPLSGTVKLQRVDDHHLIVSYRIDRTPAASAINFKVGEPKELRRER